MASRTSVFWGDEVRIRFHKALFSFFNLLLPLPLSLSLVTLFISSLKPLKQTWSSHQHLIHQPGPPWPAGEELGVRATVVSVFCSQEAGAVKVWVVCACVRVEYEAHTHFCSLTSTNRPFFLKLLLFRAAQYWEKKKTDIAQLCFCDMGNTGRFTWE